jgi:ComF family protein
LDKLFWNRVEVHHVCALYFYDKGQVSQSLIRALKYEFKAPLGIYLGEHMAKHLQTHPICAVDAIVAVPIHPKKKFARGYNQSELLARGISNVWGAPILNSIAHKRKHTASQTTRDRFGRWENVQNLFVGAARIANYRHVLLVDDVITTGATLESLTKAIKAVDPTIQISLLSFAFTK